MVLREVSMGVSLSATELNRRVNGGVSLFAMELNPRLKNKVKKTHLSKICVNPNTGGYAIKVH